MYNRPPLPPFTQDNAIRKVQLAEDGWNSRDPQKVAQAYTADTVWRNRAQFITGRTEVEAFLQAKWQKEQNYRLVKELWAHSDTRIAVRFAYEWQNAQGVWFRSFGNENWAFTPEGLMHTRIASINDLPIKEEDRKMHWPLGPRPSGFPGLTELGL